MHNVKLSVSRNIFVVFIVRILIAAFVLLAGAGVPNPTNAATVRAPLALAGAGKGVAGRYIVVMRTGRVAGATALRAKADVVQTRGGARVTQVFGRAVNGFVAELTDVAVNQMRLDPDVAFIEQDQIFRAIGTQSNPPWGLDRLDQRSLPLNSSYSYDVNGAGVHAYIIDTGIRSTHSDFAGRVAGGYDAVDGGTPDDCNGHGTHVAGTVGGSSYGVAKGVTLHGVRVLDCGGSGYTSGVIAGIDWVTANHVKPAVANMSLGGGASSALDLAVRNSVAAGVTYAVAAGNENTDACNSSPAREASAITVGATSSSDQRASFSNYGACLDVFAPGVGVLSSWHTGDSATASLSGTSMASPHTAGVAALFLARSPNASPSDVAAALTNAASSSVVGNAGAGSPNRLLYSPTDGIPTITPGPSPTPTLTPIPTATPVPSTWDDFSLARAIAALPFSETADTSGATRANDDPTLCTGQQHGSSVWYRIVPAASARVTIATASSNYDTVLAVFTGSRGALTRIACNDDESSSIYQSRGVVDLVAGTTYYVEVADYWSTTAAASALKAKPVGGIRMQGGGSLTLALTPETATATPTPSVNTFDEIASPRSIAALPFSEVTDTSFATSSASDPILCTGYRGSATVWYRFTAPASGRLTARTSGSSYDTVVSLFRGGVEALQAVACNDDAEQTLQSVITADVVSGTIYYIEVADYSMSATSGRPTPLPKSRGAVSARSGGTLALAVALASATTPTVVPTVTPNPTSVPPANDDASSPQLVPALPAVIVTTTLGSTLAATDPILCTGYRGSSTVWYRFTAPMTGSLVLHTAGSSYDTVLAVFTQENNALTLIGCNDDASNTLQSRLSLRVAGGQSYLVEVADFALDANRMPSSLVSTKRRAGSVGVRLGGQLQLTFEDVIAPTATPTRAPTRTATRTVTRAATRTAIATRTVTRTATRAVTRTATRVITRTPTRTPIPTPTLAPLTSDDFAQPMVVAPLPFMANIDTAFATSSTDDPALCTDATGAATVWFRYTASATGRLVLGTTGSDYDTVLAVFQGNRGVLTRLACNDDAGGSLSSRAEVLVVAGQTYYIEVADFWSQRAAQQRTKATATPRPNRSVQSGGRLLLLAEFVPLPPTRTATATRTPTRTVTATRTPVPTNTATATATRTPTRTVTVTHTPVPTNTPTETPTETSTPKPLETPTEVPTDVPTEVPTDVPTETPTSTPTEAPTSTPTETPTETPTSTPTETPTSTPTETPTSTPTETPVP